MKNKYIGITEDRLKHTIGVARRCYEIAKRLGYDERYCRKMFAIGFNHDIGYEFSREKEDHAKIGYQMLLDISHYSTEELEAIECHGKPIKDNTYIDEFRILNLADLTIDSKGNKVKIEQRLKDIKERYGEESLEYKNAFELTKILKNTKKRK